MSSRLVVLRGGGAAESLGRLESSIEPAKIYSIDDVCFCAGMPNVGIQRTNLNRNSRLCFEVEVSSRRVGHAARLLIGLTADNTMRTSFSTRPLSPEARNPYNDWFDEVVKESTERSKSVWFDLSDWDEQTKWPSSRPKVGTEVLKMDYKSQKIFFGEHLLRDQVTNEMLWQCNESFTVGIALDYETGCVHFAVNGDWDKIRAPVHLPEEILSSTLFPAVCGKCCAPNLSINAGDRGKFKYAPPNADYQDFASRSGAGDFPVTAAARAGHAKVCESLMDWLKKEELLNVKDSSEGNSLLHFLAAKGCTDTVQLLIGLGADANIVNAKDATPAFAAAESDHADVLKLLCENSKNSYLSATNTDGDKVIHVAARFGSASSLLYLCQKFKDKDLVS